MSASPQMLAYFQGEWNAGRLTRPQNAVTGLTQNPEIFLRKHPILNTFDCATSGVTNAYLRNDRSDALRPGSKLGTLNMHKTESFNLESVSGVNSYGYTFPVHGVHMGQSTVSVDEISWYALDATGPAIMLTAKLTGCTFVARAGKTLNTVEVTHLQPHNETGLDLNTRMKSEGAAYGRLRYDLDTRSINVVGVRTASGWQIWAQKLDKNASPPKILSLNRIWPV
jgi:hypothetical protein